MNRRSGLSLLRPFGLLAAILMAAFAGIAPSAFANDTPGNNGTVKIHEGAGENDPGEVRNEPHVCTFHLHFYFADPEQAGTWEIQEWAPTGEKGTVVLSGTYDTAGDGEDRQPEEGVYTLPDGHYKLFWDGDLDTGKHDKMKVFWVDCAPANESAPPSGSEQPIESTAPSASAVVSSAPPSTAPSTAPSSAASTVPGGSELPIAGSQPPGGEVLGIEGTPPSGATPPPTDTEASAVVSSNDGWRVALIALAALIAAAPLLIPAPTVAGTRTPGQPRR
jgi:hypothetical protein